MLSLLKKIEKIHVYNHWIYKNILYSISSSWKLTKNVYLLSSFNGKKSLKNALKYIADSFKYQCPIDLWLKNYIDIVLCMWHRQERPCLLKVTGEFEQCLCQIKFPALKEKQAYLLPKGHWQKCPKKAAIFRNESGHLKSITYVNLSHELLFPALSREIYCNECCSWLSLVKLFGDHKW